MKTFLFIIAAALMIVSLKPETKYKLHSFFKEKSSVVAVAPAVEEDPKVQMTLVYLKDLNISEIGLEVSVSPEKYFTPQMSISTKKQIINQSVKEASAAFTTKDIVSKRKEFTKKVESILSKRMEYHGYTVTSVRVAEIRF